MAHARSGSTIASADSRRGTEADFIVLDLRATPLMARRMDSARTLEEKLLVLMTLADERVVASTYVMGRELHRGSTANRAQSLHRSHAVGNMTETYTAKKKAPRARRPAQAKRQRAPDVYERIWSAIMDHSLPPETRLVEERLCEIFGLGRTRLRQVLQRLAHERVVTLMPNRGAIVSRPSIREAREVFAARRVLEAGIVQVFLENATRADVKRVQEHVARERAAWVANDRRAMLKLSGEFHLVMAEIAGNSILIELCGTSSRALRSSSPCIRCRARRRARRTSTRTWWRHSSGATPWRWISC